MIITEKTVPHTYRSRDLISHKFCMTVSHLSFSALQKADNATRQTSLLGKAKTSS